MSVVLLITKDVGKEDVEDQPIATQGVFLSFWKPIIRANELEWLPHFEEGIVLEREDLPMVIRELEIFIFETEKLSRTKLAYSSVRTRAQSLLDRLLLLQKEPFHEVFVG